MRTTITIDDGLLETAKRRARERHTTLGKLIEDGLRREFAVIDEPPAAGPPLPVFHGGGLRPGIDPASNASLFDAAGDRDEAFARLREPSEDPVDR